MLTAINAATTMPYSLREEIPAMGKAGIAGVELWWSKIEDFLKTESVEALSELLKENGVKPVGICPFPVSPFRDTQEKRDMFLRALEVCRAIGCELLTVCPEFCPINVKPEEAFKLLADEMSFFAQTADGYGVKLAIEPISRHTLVKGPLQALALIEAAGAPDNLGLLIDTFHYSCSAIPSEEIRAIPAEKLYIVHVNDCAAGMREELCDADRLYPTEGYIDLAAMMADIRATGYDGYLSVELFNREYWKEPAELICRKAKDSCEALMKL